MGLSTTRRRNLWENETKGGERRMLLKEAREYAGSSQFDRYTPRGRMLVASLYLLALKGGHDVETWGTADGTVRLTLFYRPHRPTSFVLLVSPSEGMIVYAYPTRRVLEVWENVVRTPVRTR
jgi:hypothetical protein